MEQLLQEPLTEFEEWNADLNKDTGVSATVWCLTYNHDPDDFPYNQFVFAIYMDQSSNHPLRTMPYIFP